MTHKVLYQFNNNIIWIENKTIHCLLYSILATELDKILKSVLSNYTMAVPNRYINMVHVSKGQYNYSGYIYWNGSIWTGYYYNSFASAGVAGDSSTLLGGYFAIPIV